jgi:hypothetical protein
MTFRNLASKALKVAQEKLESPKSTEVRVTLGANFLTEMERAIENNPSGNNLRITFNFPGELMQEVDDAIGLHRASANVLYSDEMQFLDVVGESFHQDGLMQVAKRDKDSKKDFGLKDDDFTDWYSGFLIPEPWNPYDTNAVMVVMITSTGEDSGTIQVGHLAKDQAKKVQKKLIKNLNEGKLVPVLMKLTGGTKEKPTIGVLARAKTAAV